MAKVKRGRIMFSKETVVTRDQGEYNLFKVVCILTRGTDMTGCWGLQLCYDVVDIKSTKLDEDS